MSYLAIWWHGSVLRHHVVHITYVDHVEYLCTSCRKRWSLRSES